MDDFISLILITHRMNHILLDGIKMLEWALSYFCSHVKQFFDI